MLSPFKVNVLLVDDHRENLLALEAALSDLDQNLVSVHSGMEALKCLLHDDYAVILLDVQMPGMDGFETARLIRERDRSRHTPIIFLTAIDKSEARVFEGYSMGAADYLFKPFNPHILRAKVATFVELSRQARRLAEEVAQRRQAEDALQQLNQDLEQCVTDRTSALQTANTELRARIAERDQAEAVREQAEASLRESEERLRLALDAGQMGVFDWNIRTGEVHWSENLFPMHGLPAGTGERTFDTFIEGVHPDDRDSVAKAVARAVESRGDYDLEFRIQWPDGGTHWKSAKGRVFQDEERRPLRMVGVCVDITQRKRLEQELHQRAEALAEADRRKDQFLAMLAHELRNPLGAISNAVQILKQPGAADAGPRLRPLIERQTDRLSHMVDDLLDVSRFTSGRVQLRKDAVDLNRVLEGAAETIRPFTDTLRHKLSIKAPEEPVWVEGDETRLEQVFSNLLHNAAKFTPAGGRICLVTEREEGWARVSVRDTGVGMPPELQPRIFEVFTQADRSIDRTQGGLGLGLTLVQSLVEQHGGSITAHSAGPGQGSEFVVRLPLIPAPRPPAEAPDPPASPLGAEAGGRKVLVVEDNMDAAETVTELLELWGHDVRLALSGAAGIETAREYHPDVIVLDIGLPGMDGYEVARRLRGDESVGTPFLIALTGYGQDEDQRRAFEAGFDRHLTKPLDADALRALLAAPRSV